MEKQVTFSHIIAILTGILIPILIWGVSVEKMREKVYDNAVEIYELKKAQIDLSKQIYINQLEIIERLNQIKLEVNGKENRK